MSYSDDCKKLCRLESKLAISYTGRFIRCEPQQGSTFVGTVLTKWGEVFERETIQEEWVQVCTPKVFLFFDEIKERCLEVNICKKCIEEICFTGRAIDCTTRIIYEYKKCVRKAVCDLNTPIPPPPPVLPPVRFSARGGTIDPVDVIALGLTPACNPPDEPEARRLIDWTELYDVGDDNFDPVTGTFTAPVAGNYQINAVIAYEINVEPGTALPVMRPFLASFVLVLNDTSIVIEAPVDSETIDINGTSFQLQNGQAVINIGLTLAVGDILRIYYFDNRQGGGGFDSADYTVCGRQSTFNAHLLQ